MGLKHSQIKTAFEDLKYLKEVGIWYSGHKREGRHKIYRSGKLFSHAFYKNGRVYGEYKIFNEDGSIKIHLYTNGENQELELPDNIKDGYILVDGKYYKD